MGSGKTCCLCFEIKCGLTIIAALDVASLCYGIFLGVASILTFNVWGLLMLIASLPAMYGGFLSLKWLMKDEQEERRGLMLACAIGVLYCMVQAALTILYALFNDKKHGLNLSAIVVWATGFFFSVYFYTVAADYSKMKGDA